MYVDGFLCAVPTANRDAYRRFAETAAPIFRACGALSLVECWGDDIPDGEITSMKSAVLCEENETVVFSWITWPSKAVRDAAMEKIKADPRFDPEFNPMPFDFRRMIFGGFEVLLEA
jgi:uncharacterized protein YbaA (DUF1428 family)